jgi:hypothetical protein
VTRVESGVGELVARLWAGAARTRVVRRRLRGMEGL